MELSRREFLSRGAALVAGGAFPKTKGREPDGESWQEVRKQFNLSPEFIHMSAMLISSHPALVREAIARYRHELDFNPISYLESENRQRQRLAREAAARYLEAEATDIALTESTTMGLGLIYSGLESSAGDEILTTEHDYYVTHESLRLAARRTGASIIRARLYDAPASASRDEIVARFRKALNSSTRAVALTWVHSGTGLKLPLKAMAEAVQEENGRREERERILLCVDGVHGFGVENATVSELGCDFFIAGCHKWLFGPRGTGIIWGRREAWERVNPIVPSFIDSESWSAWIRRGKPAGRNSGARMSPGGFKAFEHQWALTEAFDFHRRIGKTRITARTHELGRHLKEGLRSIRGVHLVTPMKESLSAGIVCFAVEGRSPRFVVDRLERRKVVATVTPYGNQYARLTPSIRNTHDEIDKVLAAVRAVV